MLALSKEPPFVHSIQTPKVTICCLKLSICSTCPTIDKEANDLDIEDIEAARNKKLLGAPGIVTRTTRSKDATTGSWPYY